MEDLARAVRSRGAFLRDSFTYDRRSEQGVPLAVELSEFVSSNSEEIHRRRDRLRRLEIRAILEEYIRLKALALGPESVSVPSEWGESKDALATDFPRTHPSEFLPSDYRSSEFLSSDYHSSFVKRFDETPEEKKEYPHLLSQGAIVARSKGIPDHGDSSDRLSTEKGSSASAEDRPLDPSLLSALMESPVGSLSLSLSLSSPYAPDTSPSQPSLFNHSSEVTLSSPYQRNVVAISDGDDDQQRRAYPQDFSSSLSPDSHSWERSDTNSTFVAPSFADSTPSSFNGAQLYSASASKEHPVDSFSPEDSDTVSPNRMAQEGDESYCDPQSSDSSFVLFPSYLQHEAAKTDRTEEGKEKKLKSFMPDDMFDQADFSLEDATRSPESSTIEPLPGEGERGSNCSVIPTERQLQMVFPKSTEEDPIEVFKDSIKERGDDSDTEEASHPGATPFEATTAGGAVCTSGSTCPEESWKSNAGVGPDERVGERDEAGELAAGVDEELTSPASKLQPSVVVECPSGETQDPGAHNSVKEPAGGRSEYSSALRSSEDGGDVDVSPSECYLKAVGPDDASESGLAQEAAPSGKRSDEKDVGGYGAATSVKTDSSEPSKLPCTPTGSGAEALQLEGNAVGTSNGQKTDDPGAAYAGEHEGAIDLIQSTEGVISDGPLSRGAPSGADGCDGEPRTAASYRWKYGGEGSEAGELHERPDPTKDASNPSAPPIEFTENIEAPFQQRSPGSVGGSASVSGHEAELDSDVNEEGRDESAGLDDSEDGRCSTAGGEDGAGEKEGAACPNERGVFEQGALLSASARSLPAAEESALLAAEVSVASREGGVDGVNSKLPSDAAVGAPSDGELLVFRGLEAASDVAQSSANPGGLMSASGEHDPSEKQRLQEVGDSSAESCFPEMETDHPSREQLELNTVSPASDAVAHIEPEEDEPADGFPRELEESNGRKAAIDGSEESRASLPLFDAVESESCDLHRMPPSQTDERLTSGVEVIGPVNGKSIAPSDGPSEAEQDSSQQLLSGISSESEGRQPCDGADAEMQSGTEPWTVCAVNSEESSFNPASFISGAKDGLEAMDNDSSSASSIGNRFSKEARPYLSNESEESAPNESALFLQNLESAHPQNPESESDQCAIDAHPVSKLSIQDRTRGLDESDEPAFLDLFSGAGEGSRGDTSDTNPTTATAAPSLPHSSGLGSEGSPCEAFASLPHSDESTEAVSVSETNNDSEDPESRMGTKTSGIESEDESGFADGTGSTASIDGDTVSRCAIIPVASTKEANSYLVGEAGSDSEFISELGSRGASRLEGASADDAESEDDSTSDAERVAATTAESESEATGVAMSSGVADAGSESDSDAIADGTDAPVVAVDAAGAGVARVCESGTGSESESDEAGAVGAANSASEFESDDAGVADPASASGISGVTGSTDAAVLVNDGNADAASESEVDVSDAGVTGAAGAADVAKAGSESESESNAVADASGAIDEGSESESQAGSDSIADDAVNAYGYPARGTDATGAAGEANAGTESETESIDAGVAGAADDADAESKPESDAVVYVDATVDSGSAGVPAAESAAVADAAAAGSESELDDTGVAYPGSESESYSEADTTGVTAGDADSYGASGVRTESEFGFKEADATETAREAGEAADATGSGSESDAADVAGVPGGANVGSASEAESNAVAITDAAGFSDTETGPESGAAYASGVTAVADAGTESEPESDSTGSASSAGVAAAGSEPEHNSIILSDADGASDAASATAAESDDTGVAASVDVPESVDAAGVTDEDGVADALAESESRSESDDASVSRHAAGAAEWVADGGSGVEDGDHGSHDASPACASETKPDLESSLAEPEDEAAESDSTLYRQLAHLPAVGDPSGTYYASSHPLRFLPNHLLSDEEDPNLSFFSEVSRSNNDASLADETVLPTDPCEISASLKDDIPAEFIDAPAGTAGLSEASEPHDVLQSEFSPTLSSASSNGSPLKSPTRVPLSLEVSMSDVESRRQRMPLRQNLVELSSRSNSPSRTAELTTMPLRRSRHPRRMAFQFNSGLIVSFSVVVISDETIVQD